MAKASPSYDAGARFFGIVGILLGLAGVVLSYLGYQWQREEIISIRLVAFRTATELNPLSLKPQGTVRIDIVMGRMPIHIERVGFSIGSEMHGDNFKDFAVMDTDDTKPLAPGQLVGYKLDWDFSMHPLVNWTSEGPPQQN